MTFRTHTVHRGARGQTVLLVASTPEGHPITGLAHDTPGIGAGFVRDDGVKGRIPLVSAASGDWSAGAFVEADPTLAPGVYRFCVPDEVIVAGATRAVIVIQAPDVVIQPVDFDIVAFDPQDDDRIGMEALAFEQRVKCLTTAFPLLAVEERKRLTAQESSG